MTDDFILKLHSKLEEINAEFVGSDRTHHRTEMLRKFRDLVGAGDHAVRIARWAVICDASNNPPSVINAGKLRVDVHFILESDPPFTERHMWFD